MMKNGIILCHSVLFKILIYANWMTCGVTIWTQSGLKSQKLNIAHDLFCIELKLSTVVTLIAKFHVNLFTVTFPWQHNGLQALSINWGKSEFSSLRKSYMLLLFIQWM